MKKLMMLFVTMSVVLMLWGSAHALQVIGTATYEDAVYNLVYEADNNGNSLVWLDYTQDYTKWQDQVNWVAGLESALTVTLDPGYSVSWTEDNWRLPTTVDEITGYNNTGSEMGYMYYESLGNLAHELNNTGPFTNLQSELFYWSGTAYSEDVNKAWMFHFGNGGQTFQSKDSVVACALAVRTADVSPVPEPTTMLLLGSGLIGLAGFRRKFRKK